MKKEKNYEKKINELSQKIFGKDLKDVKYLMLTNYIHQQLLEENLSRAGLYNWINVFRGEVKIPQQVEDYNQYDIIHINLSGQDLNLVNTIREKLGNNTKTKIIANNDYTTEMWSNTFMYPETHKRETQGADMLFGTEKFMCRTLSEITGRKVYEIPHPCDIKRLKVLKSHFKEDTISVIHHRYDNPVYLSHFATRNHGLRTQIIGYEKSADKQPYVTSTLYDKIYLGTNNQEFMRQMQSSRILYEGFTYNSHGRATIEAAALGLPVVGSNRVQSMRKCYPFTICDPYDTLTARHLIHKLLTDKKFEQDVIEYAKNASEYYNYENSTLRFLSALDDALSMKKEDDKND